jgi:quinolinate synthase
MTAATATIDQVTERLHGLLPDPEVAAIAPTVAEIERLKRTRNAVVIAHNYMTTDIFHSVSDYTGDSLGMAMYGARTDADVIVLAGVHFMAETAKVLAPHKTVLIPDLRAGCSLASSITASDIAQLRAEHPGVPVVTYVNTTAAVKAASDVCCTSANVVSVVEWAAKEWGTGDVLLLPDRYLARYARTQTDVRIHTWEPGACEVHERFTGAEIDELRVLYEDIAVIAHPECPPEVIAAADMTGSTSAMGRFIEAEQAKGRKRIALITECSMASNLQASFPEVEFVAPCNMCPHMKRITLDGIRNSLQHNRFEVDVDAAVIEGARTALDRMLAIGRTEKTS